MDLLNLKIDGFWNGFRRIYLDFGLDFQRTTKLDGFWFGVNIMVVES